MPQTARCVHEHRTGGILAGRFNRIRHSGPFAKCGAWPAIVCGNRRPDSRPLQSATITRPERAPAELPGRTGELVESHGIEPRSARGVRFTAGWVCRIPHSPKKGAPGIRPDGLPIPRREGQSRSSLVCWYCLRCQANRFYGPARSRRQRRPFDPWMGNLVDLDGVEPTTFRLQGGCSTN